MLKNTETSWGSVAKLFHWTISLLIIGLLIVGALMGYAPPSLKGIIYNTHKLIGLFVLLLVILRISWRCINITPRLPDALPRWMVHASQISHRLLYLLMLSMPISGWVMSSAAGQQYHPHLFGFTFGLPIATNRALAQSANQAHELLAWMLLMVLITHISAALYHHFIRKDEILIRMMPGKRS